MKKFVAALIFSAILQINFAQDNTPCRCCGEKFRQFDFWIGNWETYQNEQLAGTNKILVLQDSCILQENWISAGSQYTGTSYNFYDPTTDKWYQTWVDNQGANLRLSGGLTDGRMVLSSEPQKGADGKIIINRITWTPNPDGTVRQHWQATQDDGKTWTTLFDGLYKRKGSKN